MNGLVIDLFAGGGGASLGIEAALGRQVDIALNHDATALAVHRQNHPRTMHLEADIWSVDPRTVTRGRQVAVLWASPDCTHFSNAKGAKPRSKKIRSLAWSVVKWASQTRPRVIFLENVTEFKKWGPLDSEGRPCKARMGTTFARWVKRLENLGYAVQYRVLDASEYGAPTRRKRLFIIARCDGMPICWPEVTHGDMRLLGQQPYRTAAECIDWSIPTLSIFGRKKPLALKTLRRVAFGIYRFVLTTADPFIVKVNHGGEEFRGQGLDEPLSTITAQRRGHALVTPFIAEPGQRHGRGQRAGNLPLSTIVSKDRHALVAPTLVQTGYGERKGQTPRVPGLHKPVGTLVADQKHAVVTASLEAAFLGKHYGDPGRSKGGGVVLGQSLEQPIGTVTGRDHHSVVTTTLVGGNHVSEVRAFLSSYAEDFAQLLKQPIRNLTEKQRNGIITVPELVEDQLVERDYQITDIGLRMMQPPELLRAQFGSYADEYLLDAATTKEAQVRLIGNSVCPDVAEAIVRANLGHALERAA